MGNHTIKIKFTQKYKSFEQNEEYKLNGSLIIISGLNGAGKSQLLEGIKGSIANVYIDERKISHQNIIKYSFRDNIALPSFGAYSFEFAKERDNVIINIYNNFKHLYMQYHDAKDRNENLGMMFGFDFEPTFEDVCFNNIGYSLNLKKQGTNNNISKNISKKSILQIINFFYENGRALLDLTNEDIWNRIPNNFQIKCDDDEIEGITRIFTEASRLRFLERNKYADTTKIFDNSKWLKSAPWTEINNLFEKMHFNYRFSDDYEYEIPYLKENPKLFAFENGKINKTIAREINDLSDGEKAILKLVIATYDRKDDNATNILLLDEYDATLNPSLIKDFYTAIQEYYLNKNIVVIITTHSPITISMAPENAKFYEIFRQNNSSPIIKEISSGEYNELRVLESFYDKIKNPILRLKQIEGENEKLKEKINNLTMPLIITEGKTDWKHIKLAKSKLNNADVYDFYESNDDMGDTTALNMLKEQAKTFNPNKRIFIFDNDNKDIIKDVTSENDMFKKWGNNVYSFVIPKPKIRDNDNAISIEHYYPDAVLKKELIISDGVTRRIYCGNDFNKVGLNASISKRCDNRKCCGPDIIRVLSGLEMKKYLI